MYKKSRAEEIEIYRTCPATTKGTFYFTSICDNRMYSVRGPMAYHGKTCPKCGRALRIADNERS